MTEFLLLQALVRHPGHVKTRDQLMQHAYPDNTFVSDRTIDSHVKRVRRKLEEIDPGFASIETVYGLGYRFTPDAPDHGQHAAAEARHAGRTNAVKWKLWPLWPFLRRASSRIAVRMLAFNVLLVFLPFAGLLYLDTYEQHLLDAQERSMVQQGRLLAAALADRDPLDAETIDRLLRPLGQRVDARLRILDATGRVLGDTSRAAIRPKPIESSASRDREYRRSFCCHQLTEGSTSASRERYLYRVGSSVLLTAAAVQEGCHRVRVWRPHEGDGAAAARCGSDRAAGVVAGSAGGAGGTLWVGDAVDARRAALRHVVFGASDPLVVRQFRRAR